MRQDLQVMVGLGSVVCIDASQCRVLSTTSTNCSPTSHQWGRAAFSPPFPTTVSSNTSPFLNFRSTLVGPEGTGGGCHGCKDLSGFGQIGNEDESHLKERTNAS
jgi:hypothetical protein